MNKQKLLTRIDDLYKNCSVKGWNSYDALPVKQEAVQEAVKFLNALPEEIDDPFISPGDDGWLEFEWDSPVMGACVMVTPMPLEYEYYWHTRDDNDEGLYRAEDVTETLIKILKEHFTEGGGA